MYSYILPTNFVWKKYANRLYSHLGFRLTVFKMADTKPEVECFSGTEWDINEIPTATPTFSTTPELVVTLPTSSDISGSRI